MAKSVFIGDKMPLTDLLGSSKFSPGFRELREVQQQFPSFGRSCAGNRRVIPRMVIPFAPEGSAKLVQQRVTIMGDWIIKTIRAGSL